MRGGRKDRGRLTSRGNACTRLQLIRLLMHLLYHPPVSSGGTQELPVSF